MRAFVFFCSATGQPASSPTVLPPSWIPAARRPSRVGGDVPAGDRGPAEGRR